jgi:hypothetical protein
MNASSRAFHTVAAALFALLALFQAARFALGFPVRIGAVDVPVAVSGALALMLALLAVWGWRTR